MADRPDEPLWLTPSIVMAIHADLLDQHGGLAGVRDGGLVLAALARPRHRWEYGGSDLFTCAAAYGFGLAKNHGFVDGNKRTAFQAMYTFLGLNGMELIATEPDTVTTMLALAEGTLTEEQLGEWLHHNSERRRRGR